jgi:hypothetical protein
MSKWSSVVGYEGLYEVSDSGMVRRIPGYRCPNYRVLSSNLNTYGYPKVHLCKENKRKTRNIHRLVAEAFIPNPGNKPQVNHINGDKEDNRVENLEWVTPKENTQHALKRGLANKREGSHNGYSKLNEEDVKEIFSLRQKGFSNSEISNRFNVDPSLISKVCGKTIWKHVLGTGA